MFDEGVISEEHKNGISNRNFPKNFHFTLKYLKKLKIKLITISRNYT